MGRKQKRLHRTQEVKEMQALGHAKPSVDIEHLQSQEPA